MRLTRKQKKQIKKAVNFWAKQLGNPKFKILSDEERKDPENRDIARAEFNCITQTPKKDFSPEIVNKFKIALTSIINEMVDSQERKDYLLFLNVDYHPCFELGGALKVIGEDEMDSIIFPLKTRMWIRSNQVIVSEGYHVPEYEL